MASKKTKTAGKAPAKRGRRVPAPAPAPAPAGGEGDCDVLVLGAGLAGLTLARQLLLASPDIRLLVVDRGELPAKRQKVGEATVQVSGYYYSRVLELEEHLLCEHYMKYNLRFYWPSERGAERYEDLSQSYIRGLSNIATYQIDRNVFEEELTRVNRASGRCPVWAEISDLAVELKGESEEGPHTFSFQLAGRRVTGQARWVVDASGRSRFLARRLGLMAPSPIRHGSSFAWVEGLVDAEKLTDLTPAEIRRRPDRSRLGHLPVFLATNHFCGEGFWFWAIPLHGKTSLGLVYDRESIPREEVATPQKMLDWVCRRYPLLARDLPSRKVVDTGGLADYAHDCTQILSTARWALVGEAGRFSDPLYSPGGDLIAIYNTLVADAILTDDRQELAAKVPLFEAVARAVYEAYVPSFAVSYCTLGDQEAYSLRYTWELTVYFAFYVFPFINDLFTVRRFAAGFLRRFSRLGRTNRGLHAFLADFYRWKKARGGEAHETPCFFDFSEVGHLRAAEACFYKVGLSAEEALAVLDEQLENLEELARAIAVHVAGTVTGDARVLSSAFVATIDMHELSFSPEAFAQRLAFCPETAERHPWKIASCAFARLRRRPLAEPLPAEAAEAVESVEAVEMAAGARRPARRVPLEVGPTR